jgi:two-component system OmpR family response regulator
MSPETPLPAARILVVDDEVAIRDMVCDALRLSNYEAIEAPDGPVALSLLRSLTVDLVITDINMPGMDGYEMLSHLRVVGDNTPAIMLTARHEKQDVTKGFKVGADDYVTKPFGLEELMLRVGAVLRRTKEPLEKHVNRLACGPIVLTEDIHEVTLAGNAVDLSPTEFDLLRILLEHQGKVVSRSKLLTEVWQINFDTGTNVVDTYISYLRKKLHTAEFEGIRTVRGVGFQITDK